MEIRQLATFKTVADKLSFHKAAEDLHYAQSTISAQVSALEEELNCRLFERLGRSIVLTEAGTDLYEYACKIIELAEEARSGIIGLTQASGTLTIRAPESFCVYRLPPLLAGFRQKMPRVTLKFITCAQEGLKRDLQKGLVDLAFLLADSIRDAALEAEMLYTEKLVLIASPQHPLAAKKMVTTLDLAGETLLLTKVECSYRRLLETMMNESRVRPGMIIEFHSLGAAIACAAANCGLGLVPEISVRHESARGDLRILPWDEDPLETACLMIRHQDKWLSPALRGFMSAVREFF